ncbi:MAG: hypothetical protein A2W19_13080 [Spirochaetes bacterium RBG_16_49_21]|nr:MAG: hypothetical protein A2W19_13080 [Spirochaetes bacterium RBG_16_49_21]
MLNTKFECSARAWMHKKGAAKHEPGGLNQACHWDILSGRCRGVRSSPPSGDLGGQRDYMKIWVEVDLKRKGLIFSLTNRLKCIIGDNGFPSSDSYP